MDFTDYIRKYIAQINADACLPAGRRCYKIIADIFGNICAHLRVVICEYLHNEVTAKADFFQKVQKGDTLPIASKDVPKKKAVAWRGKIPLTGIIRNAIF